MVRSEVTDVVVLVVHQNGCGWRRLIGEAERSDDDLMPYFDAVRRRSIYDNVSRTAWARNDVGLEPLSIIHIPDVYQFIRLKVCPLNEVGINGDTAHIVQVGLGHSSPMDFALEHIQKSHSESIVPEIERGRPS